MRIFRLDAGCWLLATLAVFFLLRHSAQASALEQMSAVAKERPLIGLVLSGGGARGAAHVGVLKVLDELRIPIDIITGTSMGAVVGGLYAYGYSSAELARLVTKTDWDDIFIDRAPRQQLNFRRKLDEYNYLIKKEAGFRDGNIIIPKGLIQGQKLSLALKSLTLSAPQDFDLFPIRFRAVAADIESGEAVALGSGELATAMRASVSIPGIFSPVEWKDRLLVDGGFANNVPIRLARELGADILIVVDLSTEPRSRAELTTPLSILNQIMGFQILHNSIEQINTLGPQDILMQPDMGANSSMDFQSGTEMVNNGVAATESVLSRLKQLSLSADMYEQYKSSRRKKADKPLVIDNIIIENQSRLSTDVIRAQFDIEPGEPLDRQLLEQNLAQLYGLDIFSTVDYAIDQSATQTNLIIKAQEKSWGPDYLRFGMSFESDLDGSSKFNVAGNYTRTPINASGGEWRSDVQLGYDQHVDFQLYQPTDKRLLHYVDAQAGYSQVHSGRYESGRQAADYTITATKFGLGAGSLFGNWGRLDFNVISQSGYTEPNIGDLSQGRNKISSGGWTVDFSYDQLDSINFPKTGTASFVTWESAMPSLGATAKEDFLGISLMHARTRHAATLLMWLGVSGIVNSEQAVPIGPTLGGFLNMSGLEESELAGRYAGVMRFVYYKEIGSSKSALNVPFYVGGSMEFGRIWNDLHTSNHTGSLLYAGSLLFALDTPVGPLFLARGFSEGGRVKNYLLLNHAFKFL